MSQAFEKASGKKVNTKLVGRRPGDAEAVWAATDTADKVLGWKSKLGVKEMCEDQWKWASKYPKVLHSYPQCAAVHAAGLLTRQTWDGRHMLHTVALCTQGFDS